MDLHEKHRADTDATEREIARFARAVQDADPATAVPSCPDWTLADLIRHAGQVHRWAATMVRDLAQRRYPREELDFGLPDKARDYPEWLAAGAQVLVSALRAADPDATMWTWGVDRNVRWWSRRQLHETVVHRCDAEIALGVKPSVDQAIAADGVDEFLANLPSVGRFRPGIAELKGTGQTLSWQCPDAGWLVTLEPAGFSVVRSQEPGAVTVRTESATDLLLLVSGRPATYDLDGDDALFQWWAQRSIF